MVVAIFVLAFLLCFVYVFPCVRTSKHVVDFLPNQVLLLFDLVLNLEYVRTCLAVEAEFASDSLLS